MQFARSVACNDVRLYRHLSGLTAQPFLISQGVRPGVYLSWDACSPLVTGYHGAVFKKFSTHAAALEFIQGGIPLSPQPPQLKCHRPSPYSSSSLALAQFSSKSREGEDNHNPTDSYSDESDVDCQESNATSPEPASSSFSSAGTIVLYTDGCCLGNGKKDARAGVGVYFGAGDSRNLAEKLPLDAIDVVRATNQVAELYAIKRALTICKKDPQLRDCEILIRTDSEYAIKCLTEWYSAWVRRGWMNSKLEPVANQVLIRTTRALMDHLNVRLEHVKGHSTSVGNNEADALAHRGAALP